MNTNRIAHRYPRKLVTEYRDFPGLGRGRVAIRYDDSCNNGHDTFSITVDGGNNFGGCMHDEIREVFPELAPLIKWHLVSDDGPMHYIANTLYWAREGNLEFARTSAVAPEASLEHLGDEQWLKDRLPELMAEFFELVDSIDWPDGREKIDLGGWGVL